MNAAEKARLAKEQQEREKREKKIENKKKRIKWALYALTVVALIAMLVFGILVFCFRGYGPIFWAAWGIAVLAVALFIAYVASGLLTELWGERLCAFLFVVGAVYLIGLFIRSFIG